MLMRRRSILVTFTILLVLLLLPRFGRAGFHDVVDEDDESDDGESIWETLSAVLFREFSVRCGLDLEKQ
jgi:hypothetical protein